MSEDDLSPERLTAKGLPTARRGYKKREVERLLESTAQAWSQLAAEHEKIIAEIEKVGGLEWLARDLGAVGADVGQILADAQETAQGLRSRARTDSVARLGEAVASAEQLLAEADQQAFHLRKDAWETAAELLDQAMAAASTIIANTEADVLVDRAEAEQEAHRLVQSAKRQAQEIVRTSRFEADRLVSEAHSMVDRLVASAMDEPESRSVEAPESAPEDSGGADAQAPSAPAGVRVIQREPRKRRRPGTGPPRSPDPGSYGDALAAEVEALHEIGEHEVVPPSVPEPEAAPSVPEVEAPAERVEIEQPEMPVAEEAQETPAEEQVEDALGALFSRLRGDSAEAEAAADVETRLPEDTDTEVAVVVAAEKEETSAVLTEPLELRERLLLPVQNSALREVKRSLLDLQNEALDTLRVSGAWHPNVDTVGDGLGSALESAVGSAAEAGADAVNELSGKARPSAVITARTSVMAALMAEDLCAQLDTALAEIDRAGPVEASSTLSRVFRAWRSDEAERWVRTVTYAAYHDSLLAGLSFSGIELVEGLAHGRLCEECPAAGGEPWDPAGDPPAGTAPPPAHLDCTCSVVPRL